MDKAGENQEKKIYLYLQKVQCQLTFTTIIQNLFKFSAAKLFKFLCNEFDKKLNYNDIRQLDNIFVWKHEFNFF